MKVTIEVDCTPEEARRAVGLPDLTPLHEQFVAQMQDRMAKVTLGPDMMANMMKSWGSASENGMDFWRKLFSGNEKTPLA